MHFNLRILNLQLISASLVVAKQSRVSVDISRVYPLRILQLFSRWCELINKKRGYRIHKTRSSSKQAYSITVNRWFREFFLADQKIIIAGYFIGALEVVSWIADMRLKFSDVFFVYVCSFIEKHTNNSSKKLVCIYLFIYLLKQPWLLSYSHHSLNCPPDAVELFFHYRCNSLD